MSWCRSDLRRHGVPGVRRLGEGIRPKTCKRGCAEMGARWRVLLHASARASKKPCARARSFVRSSVCMCICVSARALARVGTRASKKPCVCVCVCVFARARVWCMCVCMRARVRALTGGAAAWPPCRRTPPPAPWPPGTPPANGSSHLQSSANRTHPYSLQTASIPTASKPHIHSYSLQTASIPTASKPHPSLLPPNRTRLRSACNSEALVRSRRWSDPLTLHIDQAAAATASNSMSVDS